ncbi:flagellar hook-associated protein FlgK [Anaeromicrobium sediminis]|uniref:Flagellar hook-associated protein 1 n=1 Tax=Anaeromicrobium sediminis TaxID=1478221 RepID=A0A267MIG9_9FIRM|nr:flagellar hook-associated protein FlgK [Anaeromicrobium sediminis]PAB59369.1 flagellar hook-associated protein FlgK [Anaeromicrobium sediminis]
MSSTFFGFNVAVSGLHASQRALYVTGHNISNANTEGYSRQRLEVKPGNPLPIPNSEGMLGTGVDTDKVIQIRDGFLDFKYRTENQNLGEWEARQEILESLELVMNEPSDSGMREVMDEFFESLQTLSSNPEDQTVRALVREKAIAFTTTVNRMGNQLREMQEDLDFNVRATVDQINGYGKSIAALNDQIFRAELDGSNANDLRDQRNLLLDKLSELTDIQTIEDGQGKMQVLIGGTQLVNHDRSKELVCEDRKVLNNDTDVPNLGEVVWDDGAKINITTGKLKALMDGRDNIDGDKKGVPYYIERLNEFTSVLADEINEVHEKGYGLNGDTGIKFFEYDPNYPSNTIKISDDIDGDLNKIAASSTKEGLPGDGKNILEMNKLKDKADMFKWGKPGDFMNSLISNLGVDAAQAKNMSINQTVLVEETNRKRQSVSGVSLDEEMSNMVRFQQSYNANARMITTMNEMLDTIINRMGV